MSSKIPSDHQLRLRLSLIEPLLAGSTCHPQRLSPSSLSNPPLSVTKLVTLQPLTCSPTIFQNRLIDIACYFTNSAFRPDILGWQGISQSCKQIDKSQLPDQIEQQFFLQSSFVLYDWTLQAKIKIVANLIIPNNIYVLLVLLPACIDWVFFDLAWQPHA